MPVTKHAAPDLAFTLTAFLSAFVAGVFFALAIGFAICLSNYSRKMLLPLLVLGVTIPKVTLLPLFILWFGIAQTPIIVFGALSGFFPMVINVMTAGSEVKPNQILLAKAMGFGPLADFPQGDLAGDAAGVGLGAVLCLQCLDDGRLHRRAGAGAARARRRRP